MNVGDKIDSLTLLKFLPCDLRSHKKGLFRCDCGEEIERLLCTITKKGVAPKSCGCRRKKKKTGGNKAISHGFDGKLAQAFYTNRL